MNPLLSKDDLVVIGRQGGIVELMNLSDGSVDRIQIDHPYDNIRQVNFNPTKELIVVAAYCLRYYLPQYLIYSTVTKKCLCKIQYNSNKHITDPMVEWSPDGHVLALSRGDTISIYNTDSWSLLSTIPNDYGLWDFTWSPCSTMLATAFHHNTQVWSISEKPTLLQTIESDFSVVRWGPDGKYIACLKKQDHVIQFIEAKEWKVINTAESKYNCVNFEWNLAGDRIAVNYGDSIVIWDVSDLSHVTTLCALSGGRDYLIGNVDWSPDGTRIISSGPDCKTVVWDVKDQKLIYESKNNWTLCVRWRSPYDCYTYP